MATITATLAKTEAADTLSATASTIPGQNLLSGQRRVRRLAYEPRLDLAIRARTGMLFRGRQKLRPPSLTGQARTERVTAKNQRDSIMSTSLGNQFAYTGGSEGADHWPTPDPRLPPVREP